MKKSSLYARCEWPSGMLGYASVEASSLDGAAFAPIAGVSGDRATLISVHIRPILDSRRFLMKEGPPWQGNVTFVARPRRSETM